VGVKKNRPSFTLHGNDCMLGFTFTEFPLNLPITPQIKSGTRQKEFPKPAGIWQESPNFLAISPMAVHQKTVRSRDKTGLDDFFPKVWPSLLCFHIPAAPDKSYYYKSELTWRQLKGQDRTESWVVRYDYIKYD
jgi:hypothetical protein